MHVLPKKELLSLQKLVHAGGYLKTKNELDVTDLEFRTIVYSKNPINLKDPLLRKQVNDSFSNKFPDEPSAMDSIWNKIDHPDNVVPFTPRPTTGRNDPCPCGSGKKYKKCCGAN